MIIDGLLDGGLNEVLYYSLFDRGLNVFTEENYNVKERTRQPQPALLVEGNKWALGERLLRLQNTWNTEEG